MNADALHNLTGYVAASLFLHAFADACERAKPEFPGFAVPHPGAGGDWADIAPSTFPQRFYSAAATAIGRVSLPTLSAGFAAWQRLTDCDAERFGHVVACRLLGHGVGLFDDIRLGGLVTAQDRADNDAVHRLNQELPRIDGSCDVVAFWNPETGQCE